METARVLANQMVVKEVRVYLDESWGAFVQMLVEGVVVTDVCSEKQWSTAKWQQYWSHIESTLKCCRQGLGLLSRSAPVRVQNSMGGYAGVPYGYRRGTGCGRTKRR